MCVLTQGFDLGGRRVPIQPEMRVEAEVKTGERRVIEILLPPVRQAVQEVGQER